MGGAGGSREIYTTDNTTPEHTLVLKDRKGFIRLALKFGEAGREGGSERRALERSPHEDSLPPLQPRRTLVMMRACPLTAWGVSAAGWLAGCPGVPLVPVFVFGEKYAYNKFHHRTGFAYFVLKVLRVPFLVFWGRYVGWGCGTHASLPPSIERTPSPGDKPATPSSSCLLLPPACRWGSFMPLPNSTLAVVVGKPMEVPRVESPSEEQVQAVLEEYSQQVLQLFHRHKGKYARRTDEHVVIV